MTNQKKYKRITTCFVRHILALENAEKLVSAECNCLFANKTKKIRLHSKGLPMYSKREETPPQRRLRKPTSTQRSYVRSVVTSLKSFSALCVFVCSLWNRRTQFYLYAICRTYSTRC